MWSRVSSLGHRTRGPGRCRLRTGLLSDSRGPQERAAGVPGPGSGSKTHECFSTSTVFYNKEDECATSTDGSTEKASENQEKATQSNAKKNLLDIIHQMKVELTATSRFWKRKALRTQNQTRHRPENLENTSSMLWKATTERKNKSSKPLNPEMVNAVSAVASALPRDRKQTVSDLLAYLRKHEEITDAQKRGETTNISNIIEGMKITKSSLPHRVSSLSHQISSDDGKRDRDLRRSSLKLDENKRNGVYQGWRLNIFPIPKGTPEAEASPTLWDLEFANQIAAVNKKPPRNGFEELIQWTKEGKLWEFPINNEAGIEDDAEFHEHIFLDKYLEDFPKKGPIRHFMELVTCGLSKNPYLSVKQKVEHIEWFRKYFQEKEGLLNEPEAHAEETELSFEMRNLAK